MALQSPIDFLAGTPIRSGRTPELISQLGGAIRSRQAIAAEEERNRLMQAQQIAEVQERQRQEAAISGLAAIENPTYQDYEKVALTLPKQRADSIRSSFAQMNKDQQQNQLKFHGEILAAIDSNPDIAVELLDERAELERNAGDEGEATELERMALAIEEGNADNVKKKLGIITAFMPGGKEALDAVAKLRGEGVGKRIGEKSFAPVTLVNKATGDKITAIPAFDPNTGKARLEKADIPEGFQISRETPEEKRQAEILTVGKKKGAEVTGKGIAARRQTAINQGLDSSEGLANLKRARALLDTVKTGGVNAASLRAKQLFGVEGADEAELSNRLGKAVLSQLRETFGAAFTAQEGAQLARIEAGFGKSTRGNRRQLEQLIKMVEKKSKEGIEAALAAEDFEAAQRIKDNMEFTLDIEAPTAQKRLKFNPTTGRIE